MRPDPNGSDEWSRRMVHGLTGSPGANHRLWQRTKTKGLPRWALTVIGGAVILGAVGGVAVYLSSRSGLAAAVMLGVGWLVAVAVMSMADLGRP